MKNRISCLSIQVGEEETSRHFVWYNETPKALAVLQYALKSDFERDGGFTDENSIVARGITELPFHHEDCVSCKVRISDLILGTEYVYRVGDGMDFDHQVYSFRTQSGLNERQVFNVVSDIHMNRRTVIDPAEVNGRISQWQKSMERMLEHEPELLFIISTGDNISSYNMGVKDPEQLRQICELEYEQLFSAELMRSIPFATTMGNHEAQNAKESDNLVSVTGYHFDLPNDDGVSGHYLNHSLGNFWFRSGDVLVIGIHANANPTGAKINTTPEIHKAYIRNACEANRDANWRILINHIPSYAYIGERKENRIMCDFFCSLCDDVGIDIVFTGHSHAFSRSCQIYRDRIVDQEKVVVERDENGYQTARITEPKGTVHYNVPSILDHSFSAVLDEHRRYLNAWGVQKDAAAQIEQFDGISYDSPMFVNVCVERKAGFRSLTVKAMRTDTLLPVDTYTIIKSIE